MVRDIQQIKAWLVAVLAVVVLVTGCAPGQENVHEGRLPPAQPLVWPASPEISRILYVTSIYGPEDLQISPGFWERLWNYLTGKPQESLHSPFGIAVDDENSLYVVDSFLKKTLRFDQAQSRTDLIPGDDLSMQSPIDIAIDEGRNRLFITDSTKGVVRIFSVNGSISSLPEGELGNIGFQRPTGIAVNSTSAELLVVDTGLNTVFRFDLVSQKLLGRIGSRGAGQGEFNRPTGICVDHNGRIIVSDALNCRVQIFSPRGEFLSTFGSAGDGPGYFARPRGVATDSDNNIYVVDALFDNVQIFDRDGRLLLAFGAPGYKEGQFWLPAGICISPDDRIYVADSFNKRVQAFQYLREGRMEQ